MRLSGTLVIWAFIAFFGAVQGFVPRCKSKNLAFRLPTDNQPRPSPTRLNVQTYIVERRELDDNFNRWVFLQKLLNEAEDPQDVNETLYMLLVSFTKRDKEQIEREKTMTITEGLEEQVQKVLDASSNGAIDALAEPGCSPGDEEVLKQLELLLPDPEEDEDAHNTCWDIVRQLHGTEIVKIQEKEGLPEWRAVSKVARLMIHFDFLGKDWIDALRQAKLIKI
mmetsp:Transcript_29143/g.67569  ORF Transcript_29143/g.67569 Transcript_29143/m.67569 type:complete len:223 (-) Transcript_29143:68-736(-)